MERKRLVWLLVTKQANIFYLTGFRGSAGVAMIGPAELLLWVDPRYTLQAKEQSRGVEVFQYRGELIKAAGSWLRREKVATVGYDDSYLTCRDFQTLKGECGRGVRFRPASGMVEELRAVKSPEEVEHIRGAGRLTSEVFEEVLPLVRPGVREQDLAAEVEYRMRRKGAEGAAFETIVASGHRAALPHGRASAKRLE